jgi:hypothetical protein
VEVDGVVAALDELFDLGLGDALGLVGGVVEDLNFQLVLRIVDPGDALDEALGDVHLVEHRELHGDLGQLCELRRGLGRAALVLPVEIQQLRAVKAVDGEDRQDSEVERNDDELEDLGGGHRFLRVASSTP